MVTDSEARSPKTGPAWTLDQEAECGNSPVECVDFYTGGFECQAARPQPVTAGLNQKVSRLDS